MAGLLDFFTSDDPNERAARLQMAQGLLSGPGSSISRLAGGMGAYQQAMAQARKEEEARRIREQQAQMQALQMQQAQEQMRRQAAAEEAAKAQAARELQLSAEREQFLRGGMGTRATPQQAMAGGGGPSVANAEQMNRPQPMDLATAIKLFGIEGAQKIAGAQDWGRPEVARTINGMSGGREVAQQFDKFGRPVGAGMEQYRAPISVDQGNKKTFADPFNLKPLAEFQQFQSPDSLASNQVTMRGQNMQDARSREGNAIAGQNGKIPPGYRMKIDGTLEAIPGGPADIKAGEAGRKAQLRDDGSKAQAASVLDTIKEAKPLVGFMTAGIGGLSASLPATPARDLQAKLTTIKANLGFDRLQQMRDQSPTGGALGQVAVQELQSLQSTVASLDQLQSPGDLKNALDKIEKHYKRWQETLGGSSGGATGDWGAGKQPARIASDAEYDALPSGATFIGPDGKTRRKP